MTTDEKPPAFSISKIFAPSFFRYNLNSCPGILCEYSTPPLAEPYSFPMNNQVAPEDRISQLPDEILITVLSLLPSYLEVARTCVLSKRWRHLWNFAEHLHLSMPYHKVVAMNQSCTSDWIKLERPKYLHWVNTTLQLHQGSHITEFIVNFPLSYRQRFDIDKWLILVMGKKVERLVLDLFQHRECHRHYTISDKVYSFTKSHCGLSSIKYLKHLNLWYLNVKRKVVEHLLSNCPVLEYLSICDSKVLLTLKVDSSCLRFLEILYCVNIKKLDIICAPKLASFTCSGLQEKAQLLIRHTPALVDVTIGQKLWPVVHNISSISSYFSQLESLTLWLYLSWDIEVLPISVELPKLKNLTLNVKSANERRSCLELTYLIEICPLLQRFTLQTPAYREQGYINMPHKFVHKYLKVVEFVANIDIELAMYFVQNAVALEKIIVDFRCLYMQECAAFVQNGLSTDVRKRVSEFRKLLPHDGISLITLPSDPTRP